MKVNYRNNPLFLELNPAFVADFFNFHAENPHYYDLIKRYALEAKRANRGKFGMRMIIERVRWYSIIEANTHEEFKINNNHSACYARMLMIDDPFFIKLFNRRISKCAA